MLERSRRIYTEMIMALFCVGDEAYRNEGAIIRKEHAGSGFQLINVDCIIPRKFGA